MYYSTLLVTLALGYPCFAQYELKWNFDSTNMFDEFDFITGTDIYNKGFAQYVTKEEALSSGLAKYVDNKVHLGVDTQNKYPVDGTGRNSVRIHSKETFDNGLLIADFAHLPVAGCGMWPAYWVYRGEEELDESKYSEIDLVENVNNATAGVQSFYTGTNCTVNVERGTLEHDSDTQCFQSFYTGTNCTVNVERGTLEHDSDTQCFHSGKFDEGCRFVAGANTFGKAFNDNGYRYNVLLLEADAIKVWYFKDGEVPRDINSENPDPTQWAAEPTVHLTPNDCDFAKQFSRYHVVINLTFCGDWAGLEWTPESECAAETGESDCAKWVAEHPEDFEETYFDINSVKLLQKQQ